ASTWNTELIEEAGVKIGEDSISSGVAGWYAPGMDIHRSPYSGRNFEYYSEDGFLSGKMGAAEMRGVRSMGVMAYMKHFALNDQETNRYGGAYFANEQEIREICLKGFEYTTTEGGSTALMVAMNRLGARWAGAHKGLMTEVLRNEWGFKGMAITDQASVSAMYYQDMISGLWAGTDLWLNSNATLWPLSAYNETVGGLSNNSVNYKNNDTVTRNLQRAAKNIIYSVTNSNAVQSYSDTIKSTAKVFPWRALLTVLDVVVWLVCAAGIAIPIILYIKGKKQPQQQDNDKTGA
ncbi:MAG: beta-glucosidase, partial [Clostridia bacterium]|nr:beta-glucosidase [Clostridia bacterium]